jgi:uncharacterized membrane protein
VGIFAGKKVKDYGSPVMDAPLYPTEVRNPRSTASLFGHPIHPMLVGFPITFITSALASDIAYTTGHSAYWGLASCWLLGAALATLVVAGSFGLIDFLFEPRIRKHVRVWLHLGINVIILVLVTVNLSVRFLNAVDLIVPTGVVLSAVSTGLLGISGWLGWDIVYRYRMGIKDDPDWKRISKP